MVVIVLKVILTLVELQLIKQHPIPKNIPNLANNEYTYTVYDRMYYLNQTVSTTSNVTNNKGYYDSNTSYSKGDFVYYNGYWYLKLYSANKTYAPGTADSYWQIMELKYNPNHLSAYYVMDLVNYGGNIKYNLLSYYYENTVGDNIVGHIWKYIYLLLLWIANEF